MSNRETTVERTRRPSIWLLAVLVVALAWQGANAETGAVSEQQVKAVFLYNFANFVHWPSSVFEGSSSAIRYCVFGDAEMAGLLAKVLANERSNGRPMLVVAQPEDEDLRSCHVIFVGGADPEETVQIPELADGAHALTVTDRTDLASRGSMIRLIRKNRRIHPVINMDAVDRGGLQVSATLLRLATVERDTVGKKR